MKPTCPALLSLVVASIHCHFAYYYTAAQRDGAKQHDYRAGGQARRSDLAFDVWRVLRGNQFCRRWWHLSERIKNRAFEFADALMGWKKLEQNRAKGTLAVQEQTRSTRPRRIICAFKQTAGFGVSNEGFRGIGVLARRVHVFRLRAAV